MTADKLGSHLKDVMERIANECRENGGFRREPYEIDISSNQYTDFEILDVPGLVSGEEDSQHRKMVETITEFYVRDPQFMIVHVKPADLIGENATSAVRLRALCTEVPAPCGTNYPPRHDYKDYTITIQTKFDKFMNDYKNGRSANAGIEKLIQKYKPTYFVSMIFDGYSFAEESYEKNVTYIHNLSDLESIRVDEWIEDIDKLARIPSSSSASERVLFNREQYRPLIGIDIVRKQIQELWLRAFREKLPKLQQILNSEIRLYNDQYRTVLADLSQQDPVLVRKTYLLYIAQFRKMISQYVAYRAEINTKFPLNKFGLTYTELEKQYHQWNRYKKIRWSAFLPAEKLAQRSNNDRPPSLDRRYIGGRHFERLREIMSFMIEVYRPFHRSRDWMESSNSKLYGAVSDYEDAEKGVREVIYTFIRETFQMGISWLTQMYTFLIDHFAKHVSEKLLSEPEFSHLKRHTKFLSMVNLDYHKTTRQFIRKAIAGFKHCHYAKMAYVSHGVSLNTQRLGRSLVSDSNSEEREEQNEQFDLTNRLLDYGKTMIQLKATSDPLSFIFSDGKFLPAIRDPLTNDYLKPTQRTVEELYKAVRGHLVYDMTTSFFANVVLEMQEFSKSIPFDKGLIPRIMSMSDEQIALLANIRIDEQQCKLKYIDERLTELEETRDAVEVVCNEFYKNREDNEMSIESTSEMKRNIRLNHKKLREKQRHKIEDQLPIDRKEKTTIDEWSTTVLSHSGNTSDNDDDEEELMSLDNNDDIEQFLLQIYRKHDEIDLKYGFLDDDEEETDEYINDQRPILTDATTVDIENENHQQDELNHDSLRSEAPTTEQDASRGEYIVLNEST
ncbi:unnamed protein product [Rotaria sordida]|uniref:Uncharacterized protein n=1 Tax=Rotaria sordida TaxID=392033 RepID=A0A819A4Q8_9BILA|nr:unnamed protein product [Rotaria sordida]